MTMTTDKNWTHRERAMLNQIKNLREQNAALAEALAQERVWRKAAWRECWDRLQMRTMSALIGMLEVYRGIESFERRFHKDTMRRIA